MKITSIIFLMATGVTTSHAYIGSSGGSNILYEYTKKRSITASGDYEDIRIDYNGDGSIDYWMIKKGTIEIESYFKSNILAEQFVRNITKSATYEYKYSLKEGKLSINSARRRPQHVRASEKGFETCRSFLKELKVQISDINEKITPELSKKVIEEDLISPQCKSLLNENEYSKMKRILNSLLTNSSGTLSKCLGSDAFSNSFKDSENRNLTAEILSAKYELQQKRMIYDSKNFRPVFFCGSIDEKKRDISAVTNEMGAISINVKDGKSLAQRTDLEHELIHRAGVFSESGVKSIQSVCRSINSEKNVLAAADDIKSKQPIPLVGNASAAAEEVSTLSTANLTDNLALTRNLASDADTSTAAPAQIAAQDMTASIPTQMTLQESGTPSVATLSANINSPQPLTDAGAAAALYTSQQQSEGLLRKANILLGSMSSTATAQTRVLTKVSSGANSQRSAADERVVEQITIDDAKVQSTIAPQKATSTDQNKILIENTGSRLSSGDTDMPTLKGETRATISPSNVRSPASIGNRDERSAQFSKKSATNGPAKRADSTSQEEVITFISRADYWTAKNKLQDSSFTEQLASQGIKILDLNGNAYGAIKGSVIFLDEGHRFVRQK